LIEKVVEELFNALFMLTDLRQILRENKPIYNFDEDQKEQIKIIIDSVRKSLDFIEKELSDR
jgi:hypothetical protein